MDYISTCRVVSGSGFSKAAEIPTVVVASPCIQNGTLRYQGALRLCFVERAFPQIVHAGGKTPVLIKTLPGAVSPF